MDDPETIAGFIRDHGFATVVSVSDGVPFASHVPVQFDPVARSLTGHLARANPQWRHFDGATEVLCIFHGPHSYISPTWYASRRAVPTWNYAVVHAYGPATIVEEPSELRRIVGGLSRAYEAGRESPWDPSEMADTVEAMLRAIVGFRIGVTRLEAKFKLGQNRSPEDRERMQRALRAGGEPDGVALAALMDAVLPPAGS